MDLTDQSGGAGTHQRDKVARLLLDGLGEVLVVDDQVPQVDLDNVLSREQT